MVEIVLEGNRYVGVFVGHQESYIISGREYEGDSEGYYYTGTGKIQDRTTGHKYFFNFSTPVFDKSCSCCGSRDLERALISTPIGSRGLQMAPGASSLLIDRVLSSLVEQTTKTESSIPHVHSLDFRTSNEITYLLSEGFCIRN